MGSSASVSTGQSRETRHPIVAYVTEHGSEQGYSSLNMSSPLSSEAMYSVETHAKVIENSKLATWGFVDRTVEYILQYIRNGSNQSQQNKDGQVPIIEDRQHEPVSSIHENSLVYRGNSRSHFVQGHSESMSASFHTASPQSHASHAEGMFAINGDLAVFNGSPTDQQRLQSESGSTSVAKTPQDSKDNYVALVCSEGDLTDNRGEGEHKEHNEDEENQPERGQEEMVS
jgi:hypothetical protein